MSELLKKYLNDELEVKYISKKLYKKMIKANKLSKEHKILSNEIIDSLVELGFDSEELLDGDLVSDALYYGNEDKEEIDFLMKELNLKLKGK